MVERQASPSYISIASRRVVLHRPRLPSPVHSKCANRPVGKSIPLGVAASSELYEDTAARIPKHHLIISSHITHHHAFGSWYATRPARCARCARLSSIIAKVQIYNRGQKISGRLLSNRQPSQKLPNWLASNCRDSTAELPRDST